MENFIIITNSIDRTENELKYEKRVQETGE